MKDLEIAIQNHDYNEVAKILQYESRGELFIALGQYLVKNPEVKVETLGNMLRSFINNEHNHVD